MAKAIAGLVTVFLLDSTMSLGQNTFPNNGNVGIGTTTPAAKLHLHDHGDEVAIKMSARGSWHLGFNLNSASVFSIVNGDVKRLTILPGGNVGIGTISPTSKLHVASSEPYAGYFTSSSLNNLTHVVHAEYNGSSGNNDITAVYGSALANPNYGTGGKFFGGNAGVRGFATLGGGGDRYGLSGTASGGGHNFGVYGTGGSGNRNYGVYGFASTPTTGNSFAYGVFGTSSASFPSIDYAVYASGDLAYTGSFIHASDAKFKENVRSVTSALAKVRQLNGRRFNFSKQMQYASMNLADGDHYGLIAQEVEKVLPELVVDAVHPGATDSEGKPTGEPIDYKGLKYIELFPLLIESIKEQQEMIEALQTENRKQQTQIEALMKR